MKKKKGKSWIEVIPTFSDAHREEDYFDIQTLWDISEGAWQENSD